MASEVEESSAIRPRILKDLNWKNQGRKLLLGPEKASLLMGQLRDDCRLLSKLRIMDYSLLIGIHHINPNNITILCESNLSSEQNIFYNDCAGGFKSSFISGENRGEVYYMGIIDILTPYSIWKKIEHVFKSIRYSRLEISTVDPVQYAKRFLSFVRDEMLFENSDYGLRTLPSIPEFIEDEGSFSTPEAISDPDTSLVEEKTD